MPEPKPNPPEETSHDDARFEATLMFESSSVSVSRQEEDVALAAELMSSGLLSEREVTAAVADWSIYGHISLAQHLTSRRLITSEQLEALTQRSKRRVDRARESVAGGSAMPVGNESMLLATLERLDGSGRVAKLLGVTVAARVGEQEMRVMEGRYELIRKLGQGGLGRVWLARDVNLNRYVALKEISHMAGSSHVIQRFKNEAEITGRLDHPSIVPIYQLGEDLATQRVFYTMRFLGRSTLQDAVVEYHERREDGDEDPMLLRQLLTAFVNVCHAIGYAHSRKVIHRDLKPENVVIDSFGQVIVIDWGLAKVVDETTVESLMDSVALGSTDRTSEGQVMGTPLYMAPEQAAGRLDELDYRTDIYGLGAILFAIITGFAPHEKTQKESADSGVGARGMITAIASGATPSAFEVHAEADPALEAICGKAMSRRRYARYQNATQLADDVQRWMAGETVSAYREDPWRRANRWMSQHSRLTQAMIGLAMIVLVALTTLAMTARQNDLALTRANFADMSGDLRELELQFRGIAVELGKDVRFLASLPPIEGIINAREGMEGEDEEVWRERLETIYAGMLRSNSDYVSISFESLGEKGEAVEIVRVQRNPADPTLVRTMPPSRLRSVEDDALISVVATLQPGDAKLTLENREAAIVDSRGVDRLTVATPIFSDVSGKFFGMTVIESDVSGRVSEVLAGLGAVKYQLYLADGRGKVWATDTPTGGVRLVTVPETIPELPEEVAQLLEQPQYPFELANEDEYIARRFYVDPAGHGLFIFARLIEE